MKDLVTRFYLRDRPTNIWSKRSGPFNLTDSCVDNNINNNDKTKNFHRVNPVIKKNDLNYLRILGTLRNSSSNG